MRRASAVPRLVLRATAAVSIARGIVGLVMPRGLARIAGVRPDATRTRLLFGLREVVVGRGLAATPARESRRWLVSHLIGDLVDIVLHAVELGDRAVRSRRTLWSSVAVLLAAAVDLWLLERHVPRAA